MNEQNVTDDLRSAVARAIVKEIGRQDFNEEIELPTSLKLEWLDQGEVDFGLVADAALEAALRQSPSAAPVAVKVKALEWESYEQTCPGDRSKFFWRALTAFGGFEWIEMHHSAFMYEGKCIHYNVLYETVEAAKAAAQADYERRILSAIETPADRRHWVMCRKCHACPEGDLPTLTEAEAAWNRRADPSSTRIATLEAALRPFADIADLVDSETEGLSDTDEFQLLFHDYLLASWRLSLFRTARAALASQPDGDLNESL